MRRGLQRQSGAGDAKGKPNKSLFQLFAQFGDFLKAAGRQARLR